MSECAYVCVCMCAYALILLFTPLLLKHPANFFICARKRTAGAKQISLLCVTQPRAAAFVVDLVYSHLECFALWFHIFLSPPHFFLLYILSISLSLSLSLSLTKQTINILLLLNTVFFLFKFWFKRLSSSRSLSPTSSFFHLSSFSISCLQCWSKASPNLRTSLRPKSRT